MNKLREQFVSRIDSLQFFLLTFIFSINLFDKMRNVFVDRCCNSKCKETSAFDQQI